MQLEFCIKILLWTKCTFHTSKSTFIEFSYWESHLVHCNNNSNIYVVNKGSAPTWNSNLV